MNAPSSPSPTDLRAKIDSALATARRLARLSVAKTVLLTAGVATPLALAAYAVTRPLLVNNPVVRQAAGSAEVTELFATIVSATACAAVVLLAVLVALVASLRALRVPRIDEMPGKIKDDLIHYGLVSKDQGESAIEAFLKDPNSVPEGARAEIWQAWLTREADGYRDAKFISRGVPEPVLLVSLALCLALTALVIAIGSGPAAVATAKEAVGGVRKLDPTKLTVGACLVVAVAFAFLFAMLCVSFVALADFGATQVRRRSAVRPESGPKLAWLRPLIVCVVQTGAGAIVRVCGMVVGACQQTINRSLARAEVPAPAQSAEPTVIAFDLDDTDENEPVAPTGSR